MTRENKPLGKLNRRQLLQSLAMISAGSAGGLGALLASRRGFAQTQNADPKFLIVIAGAGGASIIDSFMAIRQTEAGGAAPNINCFPDAEVSDVPDSPFRAVHVRRSAVGAIPVPFETNQIPFATKHHNDLMVVTQTGTSVNHTIAQKRAITGNEAWAGRTLQEAVAAHYGAGFPLPNVNMATGGYLDPGTDRTLPAFAAAEPVAQAALWPLSLDGFKGLKGVPSRERFELARRLRDEHLDPESNFYKTFKQSERLTRWLEQRGSTQMLETQDLIKRLNVFPDMPPAIPLSDYGLEASPDGMKVRQAFPKFATDPLEAQAALAFLLLKNRVSVTVTIAPSFNVLLDLSFPPSVTNPPLAFDFSHQSHRAAQAVMWNRILSMADRLIDLLKAEEYANGQSFWDRSMIYFACDFGRSKKRVNSQDDFGSAHDLNNGYAILSPMVNGNKVLGGVDPATAMTYGFDPEDPAGVPVPNTHMAEKQIYSGILHAMGVDTAGSGLPNMRAMRKNA